MKHSIEWRFGSRLGVGGRLLGYGAGVCKLYDSTFGAQLAKVCNHLRKVDQGRSASDRNKRGVKNSAVLNSNS